MSLDELRKQAETGDPGSLIALAHKLDEAQRFSEATDALSRAANAGSWHARYLVGLRLLVGLGAPMMPAQGIGLITESAANDGEAAHRLGVLSALGAHVEQSWPTAFDWLGRAAELGSEIARRQLGLLADRRPPTSARSPTWAEQIQTIDLHRWLTLPATHVLSPDPSIGSLDEFIPAEISAWLIERAKGKLQRAWVYNGAAPRVDQARTNTGAQFNLMEADLVTVLVQARMAAAAHVGLNQLEAMMVLHYAVGEAFVDHFDFVDPRSPNAADDIARHGQRIITFLIYLNEGCEGGETAFPRLGLAHKPRAGEALFFHNTDAQGAPDLRTLHAGRPPRSGEKWVVSQFIRNRPMVPGTMRPH